MSTVLDSINELRRKHGSLPIQNADGLSDSNGYTNTNDLLTLTGALGLGAAEMTNNTLVGGAGLTLGNIGRLVESVSPWSGDPLNEHDRNLLYKLGYSTDEINEIAPYEDSWITSAAKGTLGLHNSIDDTLKSWEHDLLGDNPTFAANVAKGSGTSLGFMGAGAAISALAGGVTPIAWALGMGGSEALSEAGSFLADAYRNGQYDNGAIAAADKDFATNMALNTGLDYFLSPFGTFASKAKTPLGRVARGMLSEQVNELLQEPSQQVIERAAQNSLDNNTGFLSELGESAKEWPETFMQLAPEVSASTALTSLLTLPMNINTARRQIAYEDGYKRLVDEREKAEETFRAIDPNNVEELQKAQLHIDNLDEAIKNYGKAPEQIRAEKLTPQVVQTQQPATQISQPIVETPQPVIQTPQVTETPVIQAPTPQPIMQTPAAPQVMGNPQAEPQISTPPINDTAQRDLGFTEADMFNPNEVKNKKKKTEPVRLAVSEAPDIASPSRQIKKGEEIDLNEGWRRANELERKNIVRVKTSKGTEVDVRYRAIEADDLITSHLDNGSINPAYPQDRQPRDRTTWTSNEQVEKIMRNIDPEMLGRNRLASDGAPIVGPDMVVESGNGRVMALRRAYNTKNLAEGYKAWVNENAASFGLDPDYVAKMKKPVIVRERISDVDVLKFASEANEASIAQMSATEHAMDDAKLLTPELLNLYDFDNDFDANKGFISHVIARMPANEQGDLKREGGKISKAGYERVQNALAAKAYNDKDILARLSETYDDDMKNVSKALLEAAPKIAAFESAGYSSKISLGQDIAEAAKTLATLKNRGETVTEYLNQMQMFDEISPEAKKILRFFDKNKRGWKRITEGLNNYVDIAMNEAKEGQGTLFGDELKQKCKYSKKLSLKLKIFHQIENKSANG